jgi:hypothetical protein
MMVGGVTWGSVYPKALFLRFMLHSLQQGRKVRVVLLRAHPSLQSSGHCALRVLQILQHASRLARGGSDKASQRRGSTQVGREDLDRAAPVHVANHPHHLGIENGDLASAGQPSGYFLMRAARK